jgi:hypothetical protein
MIVREYNLDKYYTSYLHCSICGVGFWPSLFNVLTLLLRNSAELMEGPENNHDEGQTEIRKSSAFVYDVAESMIK